MQYRCDGCGHFEVIWNSRDGVTPFGTGCPSCGTANMRHVNFSADKYAPEHRLFTFQKFWRDGTPEEAMAAIERRIAHFASRGHPVPAEVAASLREEAKNLTGEWEAGWPTLDVHMERQIVVITGGRS